MEASVIKTIDVSSTNLILIYANGQFLCTDEYQVLFTTDYLATLSPDEYQRLSMGTWHEATVELIIIKNPPTPLPLLPNAKWQTLRTLMLQTDATTFKMLGVASQVANWAIDHQFCGRCGHRMELVEEEHHRMGCPHCDFFAYPRLTPSMIVLVTRGDDILLARSPRFTNQMYSTLAGFVEVGESVEQCVHREVAEEVGITINNLRYKGSQNWPYPYALMLGFHADYEAGDIVTQPDEIEDAQWFNIKHLPKLPPKQAISRYLIDLYLAERLATPQPILPY